MAVRTLLRVPDWSWAARNRRRYNRRNWPGVSLPALHRLAAADADHGPNHRPNGHCIVKVSEEFHKGYFKSCAMR